MAPFPTPVVPREPEAAPYLLFLGRISPEKRPDRAIAVAKACDITLKIAAKVDAADRANFLREIEPLLDNPLIDFVGEAEKPGLLGGALALLFPIDWPEPFGLVMIEAMSYGTPVVAWRCGSVPEVMEDGVTNFIVETDAEAIDAVGRLGVIDRAGVKAVFENVSCQTSAARNRRQSYLRWSPPSMKAAGRLGLRDVALRKPFAPTLKLCGKMFPWLRTSAPTDG